ncbi:hypothetical protein FAGAP_6179 [Fusarium agapanthi]|uniref:BTB domain-containing protein n=1 Tax=Fusarium agapanthi TaxID=1803897 RepID=A0A9P5EE60_9HYPO|nr:hypothetical protein FAGAP_6179 [Fusarium agapanthi]
MEPLGALASAVTIVGLMRPTAKFVRSLRGITSDDGHVAKEIERMAERIQASATCIDVSLRALKGYASTLAKMQRAPSEVLQYIIDNKSMDIIVSGTESIRKQMRDTSRDLNDTNNRSKILRKINWLLLDKMEVESLFPEMQVVASCLNLVCPIIGLEINRYLIHKSSGEVAECLKQEIVMKELWSSMNGESDFEAATKSLFYLSQSIRRTTSTPQPNRAPAGRRSPVPGETLMSPAPSKTPQPSPGSRRPRPHSVPVPREVPSEVTRHTSSSTESSRPHSAVPSSSPQTPDTPLTPRSPDTPKPLGIDISAREREPESWVISPPQSQLLISHLSSLISQHLFIQHSTAAPPAWPLRARRAKRSLLETGAYSDLTISCGKDQYRVHKAIICPRSHFFEAACNGEFKEAQTSTIDLPDDDPIAVRMMIEYLYHDTYMPPNRDGAVDTPTSATDNNEEKDKRKREPCDAAVVENKRTKRPDALPEDSRVYSSQPVPPAFGAASTPPPRHLPRPTNEGEDLAGADEDVVPSDVSTPPQHRMGFKLRLINYLPHPAHHLSHLLDHLRQHQPRLPLQDLYALGEKYGIEPLKALALSNFESETQNTVQRDDFLAAIREAYTSTIETDRPLRDAVVAFLRRHKYLLKRDYMKEVLKETGLGLGFDLLMEMASE